MALKKGLAKARAKFSGDRVRWQDGEYDLDLTYVQKDVIAMGFPSTGVEKTYRNNINDVSRFLNERHGSNFMIINLAGRRYDEDKFMGPVLPFGFPDHHAPPLAVLFSIVRSIVSWLKEDEEHVIVVHCLAGKGRTGTIISCFLLMAERVDPTDPKAALDLFAIARSASGDGVAVPSQQRYVHYFAKVLARPDHAEILSNPPRVIIKRILITGRPRIDRWRPALQLFTAPSEAKPEELIFSTLWNKEDINELPGDEENPSILIDIERVVSGDILVMMFHKSRVRGAASEVVARFSLNTFFMQSQGVVRLTRADIDLAYNDERFSPDFTVDLFIEDSSTMDEAQLQAFQDTEAERLSFEQGMEGFLSKRGEVNSALKKRWFVLKRNELHYYRKKSALRPAGSIVFGPDTSLVVDSGDDVHMSIVAPGRVYHLVAADAEDRDNWIRALAFAKSRASSFGRTSIGRPSVGRVSETPDFQRCKSESSVQQVSAPLATADDDDDDDDDEGEDGRGGRASMPDPSTLFLVEPSPINPKSMLTTPRCAVAQATVPAEAAASHSQLRPDTHELDPDDFLFPQNPPHHPDSS